MGVASIASGYCKAVGVLPVLATICSEMAIYYGLDQDIEQLVNDAILRPGSYYAYGRIGVIILAPASRRIVYAYRG